jgi:SH3 domain-containing YSC84-like protein 1
MRKSGLILALLAIATFSFAFSASDKDEAKNQTELQRATEVVQNMTSTAPDKGIPKEVFEGAKCVAVIPELIKGAFVVGGEHGTGVATCRTANGWSSPAPFAVSGISFGPQIGGKSTDLLFFVMNEEGMKSLMSGHFKVGGDVSAAAGPVGRQASAEGGWKAAILTYSRSKGAFIGASLNGAVLQQNDHATRDWYGKDVTISDILTGKAHTPNAQARAFVNAVQNAKVVASAERD